MARVRAAECVETGARGRRGVGEGEERKRDDRNRGVCVGFRGSSTRADRFLVIDRLREDEEAECQDSVVGRMHVHLFADRRGGFRRVGVEHGEKALGVSVR